MAQLMAESEVLRWLQSQGIGDPGRVMEGIDTTQPMYLRRFDVGEKLAQYRDRPSVQYPDGSSGGQWFALPNRPEDDLGSLGIGSGLAGRDMSILIVVRPFEALETTARSMANHPVWERYTGPGGATQVFIPDGGKSSLGGTLIER